MSLVTASPTNQASLGGGCRKAAYSAGLKRLWLSWQAINQKSVPAADDARAVRRFPRGHVHQRHPRKSVGAAATAVSRTVRCFGAGNGNARIHGGGVRFGRGG